MVKFFIRFFMFCVIFFSVTTSIIFIQGCQGDAPTTISNPDPDSGGGDGGNSKAASISLTTSVTTDLSLNATAVITAKVIDKDGNIVSDGTKVTFSTNRGKISEVASTENGDAIATFTGTSSGTATIKVTSGGASNTISIKIAEPADAGSMEFDSATPTVIGVKGSGVSETSLFKFKVWDINGNPIIDGIQVDFKMEGPDGGESLSYSTVYTANGFAATTLKSGTVSGTVIITATVTVQGTAISASSTNVTIAGGPPSGGPPAFDDTLNHISLAFNYINIAGGIMDGLEDGVTLTMGDRYGNPVPENTAVYFTTDGGSVTGQGLTNSKGQATATLISTNPKPAGGFVRVLAFSIGEEGYIDSNANGLYDSGETFADIGEPYIDSNGNNQYDVGEVFRDWTGAGFVDGVYDEPNGSWDSRIFVWDSGSIVFSEFSNIIFSSTPPVMTGSGRGVAPVYTPLINNNFVDVLEDQSLSLYVLILDNNYNSLTSATSVSISLAGSGVLISNVPSGDFVDCTSCNRVFSFTIRASVEATCTLKVSDIKVSITSEGRDTSPGGNGNATSYISGSVCG